LGGPRAYRHFDQKHFQDEPAEPQIPRLRFPGFPVELGGFVALHAPFFTEGRTPGLVQCCWQEIRVGMTKGTAAVPLRAAAELTPCQKRISPPSCIFRFPGGGTIAPFAAKVAVVPPA
jgi:hypothetical protein